jgi:hypothetical protein
MITLFLVGCMMIGMLWIGISIAWAMAKVMIWIGAVILFFPAIVLLTMVIA